MDEFRYVWSLRFAIPWPPNTTLETVQSSIGSMLQLEFPWVMGHPWWIHPCLERIISATHMGTSDWNDLEIRINPPKKMGPRWAKMRQATSSTGVSLTSSDRMGFEAWWTATATSARRFGSPSIVADQEWSGHGMMDDDGWCTSVWGGLICRHVCWGLLGFLLIAISLPSQRLRDGRHVSAKSQGRWGFGVDGRSFLLGWFTLTASSAKWTTGGHQHIRLDYSNSSSKCPMETLFSLFSIWYVWNLFGYNI